jgi:hypothetical protein
MLMLIQEILFLFLMVVMIRIGILEGVVYDLDILLLL